MGFRWRSAALLACALVVVTACAGVARAALTRHSGDVAIVSPPASVEPEKATNDSDAIVFGERSNDVLDSGMPVDIANPGSYSYKSTIPAAGAFSIARGTCVNSYFVHADQDGIQHKVQDNPPYTLGGTEYTGSITFDRRVLGIAAIAGTLNWTDPRDGTYDRYSQPGEVRDSEGRDKNQFRDVEFETNDDSITLSGDRMTVSFHLRVLDVMDEFRVFTACDPRLAVTKTATPSSLPEPGGSVTYTVVVHNASLGNQNPITIKSLLDRPFGDLDGRGSCRVGAVIAPGERYACSFSTPFAGKPGDAQTDTVTATGHSAWGGDDTASDSATASIYNLPPAITVTKTPSRATVPEPGGVVEYAVVVHNASQASSDPVTLTSMVDDVVGDLDAGTSAPHSWLSSTCNAQSDIPFDGDYRCSFTARVDGLPLPGPQPRTHTNTVTVNGHDDEDTPATAQATAHVDVVDVEPRLEVTKTGSRTNVDEPGAPVTYTVTVKNVSPAASDPVTVDRLSDRVTDSATSADRAFDLDRNASGPHDWTSSTCETGKTLAIGDSYTCTFTAPVQGAPLPGPQPQDVRDVVTASGLDNEHTRTPDASASWSVHVDDMKPSIEVTKTADKTNVDEPGGAVAYTVTVRNTSPSPSDPVTIASLRDHVEEIQNGGVRVERTFDLDKDTADAHDWTESSCDAGVTIAVGDTYTCRFVAPVTGAPLPGPQPQDVKDTVTVEAIDNESTPADPASASWSVHVDDVLPAIEVTKTASASEVKATGDDVTFTVVVRNTSAAPSDPVTLDRLVDVVSDDKVTNRTYVLDKDATAEHDWSSSTCDDDVTIAAGDSYTCAFVVHVEGVPWIDHVDTVAAHGHDNEGDAVDGSSSVRIDMVLPPTNCKVTWGGQFVAANGDPVAFGGNAMPAPATGAARGQLEFHDRGPARPFNAHSTPVTASYCPLPGRPWVVVFGAVRIDGAGSTEFRLDLWDNGEPGTSDRARLRLANGYDSGERTLSGGNVQIHNG